MLIVIKYPVLIKSRQKLECGVGDYLCFLCVGIKHTKANGKRVLEVFIQWYCLLGIPSMLCNGNVRKRYVCYVRHPMQLLVLFAIKTMLKSLHVLLGLSPVWNCYPKVDHKKGTT